MGHELKIAKELAVLNATVGEWQSFKETINATLPDSDFRQLFNKMIGELPGAYQVIIDTLAPLYEIDELAKFADSFEQTQKNYQKSFLEQASKPRHYAEAAHEIYIEISTLKESKTGYPILKRSFDNLYQFMDKWVTNDAWIIMGSDVIIKTCNRLLLEIAELKKQDLDEAWLIYKLAIDQFKPLTQLLAAKLQAF